VTEAALRLFVALELADEARRELVGWGAGAVGAVAAAGAVGLAGTAVRLVAAQNLHVTLCFLGAQPGDAVTPLLEACSVAASLPAAELRLGHGLWLPPRAPRVLAVSVEDKGGHLGAVQSRMSEALTEGGWYRGESRRFLPHVTVGRVGRGARAGSNQRPAPASAPMPAPMPAPAPVEFAGRRVTLYRSVLGGAGARYEVLGGVTLGG
jgi:2'-5' RNA ligase